MAKQARASEHDKPNRFWLAPFVGVLVLVALVAVYTWQVNRPTPQATVPPLLGIATSQVTQMTITDSSGTLQFYPKSSGSTWYLGSPTGPEADNTLVTGFVGSLATLTAVQTVTAVPTASELTAYGLSPATKTVVIERGSLPTKTLLVGSESPVQNGYYAQVQGNNTVYLINTSLAQEISSTESLWLPPPSGTSASSASTTSVPSAG